MRQLAYYHVTPQEHTRARIDDLVKDVDGNPIMTLPQLGKEAYLISLLYSAGTVTQTGNGIIGLSWQELKAWQEVTLLEQTIYPWELQIIKEMSIAYASEYARAYPKDYKAPYSKNIKGYIDRKAISTAMKEVLHQMSEAHNPAFKVDKKKG
jgi:hypothetical protein